MNLTSKTLLALCSFAMLGTAHAGERIISCEITPSQPTVNSIRKMSFYPDGSMTIVRSFGKRAETEHHRYEAKASGGEWFSWNEVTKISQTEDKAVSDRVLLLKMKSASGEKPSWTLMKDRVVESGRPGCLKNEDYQCYDSSEVIENAKIDCFDTKDSEPAPQPGSCSTSASTRAAIASDPCNPRNWGK